MMLIDHLKWRYATKQFDPSKKITEEQLNRLKEAVQLTPSSFGLQPFKVLVTNNDALKASLVEATNNQVKVSQSSHLFIFCVEKQVTKEAVEQHVHRTAKANNVTTESLATFESYVKSKVIGWDEDFTLQWSAKQAYMAMTNLLNACAESKIDACPIEGFSPQRYIEILDLTTLTPVVVVAVGYRAKEDHNQFRTKTRKSLEELFIEI